jgi:hypothetical protein
MKSIATILGVALFAAAPVSFVQGQATTPSPASGSKPATEASPAARTDVYHIHFAKAAAGKAVQMAENLKKPDPKAPMPGHILVLRHHQGEAWDYVAIEHLGTKFTLEAARPQIPPEERNLGDWHNDTYVNGPSWAEFTKAMGISDDARAKSSGSVYVVSTYRAVTGQRETLEKFLSEPPNRPSDTSVGNVLMMHLEGSEWNFLTIVRYNSWQEFATNETNSVANTAKNEGGWFKLREYIASHADTVTVRVAP